MHDCLREAQDPRLAAAEARVGAEAARRLERSAALPEEDEAVSPLSGMSFLCAEDNAINAEILEMLLETKGASCTICSVVIGERCAICCGNSMWPVAVQRGRQCVHSDLARRRRPAWRRARARADLQCTQYILITVIITIT